MPASGILVAGLAGAGVIATSDARRPAPDTQRVPMRTARVDRRTLSARVSDPGVLTYRGQPDGSPYAVIDQATGIYTELPAPGQVIGQGHVLYRVDGTPVVLLRGSIPAYRTLSSGMSGSDVAQLNSDLVALGDATAARLRPHLTTFGSATTAAVKKLQAAVGLPRSGRLTRQEVAFEPVAMRVTAVPALLGTHARPGQTVIQATSRTRIVQVALDASQQTRLRIGDTVGITLPDDRTTPGVVSSVGAVATCPRSSAPSGSSAGSAAPGTDGCASSGPTGATPTITVTVVPRDLRAAGRWDEASVQVGITTGRVRDALVVPVTALLARAGGGYAIEVTRAGGSGRLVPVSLGLFDDAAGLVQVTGPGVAPGETVVVAGT